MNNKINELKGIITIKSATKLLQRMRENKVTWNQIAEDRITKAETLKDFEEINKALSKEIFRGSIKISLFQDGTADVSWIISEINEEQEP